MRKCILTIIVLFIICLLNTISGCNDSSSPSNRANTPMGVLTNMMEALESGESEDFRACFDTSGKHIEMLESLCEFVSAGRRFSEAMEKAYGGEELRITSRFAGHSILCNEAWLDNVNIEIRDNFAVVTSSSGGEVIMVKQGAIWKIDPQSVGLPQKDDPDEELAGVGEWFRVRARHMSEAQKKIGKPDYTAQKIMQELREAESISGERIHSTSYPSSEIELTSESEKCLNQIADLERSLWLYAHQHSGDFPDPEQWQEVLINEDITPSRNFICPAAGSKTGPNRNDYVMVPWPGPDSFQEYDAVAKRDLLVVFERNAHHNGRRSVATADHIPTIIEEAEFRRKLGITIEKLKEKGISFQWSD